MPDVKSFCLVGGIGRSARTPAGLFVFGVYGMEKLSDFNQTQQVGLVIGVSTIFKSTNTLKFVDGVLVQAWICQNTGKVEWKKVEETWTNTDEMDNQRTNTHVASNVSTGLGVNG